MTTKISRYLGGKLHKAFVIGVVIFSIIHFSYAFIDFLKANPRVLFFVALNLAIWTGVIWVAWRKISQRTLYYFVSVVLVAEYGLIFVSKIIVRKGFLEQMLTLSAGLAMYSGIIGLGLIGYKLYRDGISLKVE